MENEELRLYCVMRADLNAPVGKLMGQAGHAFLGTVMSFVKIGGDIDEYMNGGMQPKIVLKAKNGHALLRAQAECDAAGILCYLVTDAARTVFTEPTVTCLGIGPVRQSELPKFIQKLQLLGDL